jgi:hypothetical protein
VAVAALICADVDEVIRVIQLHRNNRRQVQVTRRSELQQVLQHFGHDMQLVADLNRNSPTLNTWARERTDLQFEQAYLVIVTHHWVAVRGRWFVDTLSSGKRSGSPTRLGGGSGCVTLTAFTWAQHPNLFV